MHEAGVTDVDVNVAGAFQYRVLDGTYLITNEFGDWLLLSPEEFRLFVEGTLDTDGELYARLKDNRFIHGEIDLDQAIARYRDRTWFLNHGPHHHVIEVTTRGTGDAGNGIDGGDMSLEIADKAVDCAFMSTSPALVLELAGGEPLRMWDVVQHVVQYAQNKNRLARKSLRFVLATTLDGMDDERLAWLVEHQVQVTYRLESGITDASPRDWATRLNEAYVAAGHDPAELHVHLAVEVSAAQLGSMGELVDLAVDLGCRTMDMRPRTQWGFVTGAAQDRGYAMDDWMAGYTSAFDRMLEHENEGRPIRERGAGTYATKILAGRDPNDAASRSPAADAIGQLAYGWNGAVYASDGGRQIAALGDDLFQIGDLRYHGYHDIMTHRTARSLVLATTLLGQPDCNQCTYRPFCGQSPADNYGEQGSIQGRMRDSSVCHRVKSVQDLIFRRLRDGDADTRRSLNRWAGLDP